MKSVLVTGASGFIGRHTLDPLIRKNYQIHAVNFSGDPRVQHPNITWHSLNLHDSSATKKLLTQIRATHLLHLAWYAKPTDYWTSQLNLEWLISSVNLLNAFIQSGGKRAVFAGTCAEYDWKYGHCEELQTPCQPTAFYGISKYSLSMICKNIVEQHNLSFAWGRLFFLFGTHEYPQRLVPSVINSLINRNKYTVMNGQKVRDFLFVTDVADALASLLDTEVTGAVNIGSGIPLTIKEIVNLVADKLQANQYITYQDNIAASDHVVTADVTRLANEVKWSPQFSLDDALDRTIEWWKRQV